MNALVLASAFAFAPQDGAVSRGDRLVRVELLSDRSAVRPGESFWLGVRLTVEPGWHVYWESPGDSGYPTRAAIRGPQGFGIGELRFPPPEREVAEGDIVSYVHHGELLLLCEVRAPRSTPEGTGPGANAAFEVEASWLVCTEVCLRGSGKARLEIPWASAGEPSAGAAGAAGAAAASEKLFAAARERLPRPWSEIPGAPGVEWSGPEESPTLTISVPGASDLELYPLSIATTQVESRRITPDDRGCRISAQVRFHPETPADRPHVRGVLRVRTDRAESFFDLDSVFQRPRAGDGASK